MRIEATDRYGDRHQLESEPGQTVMEVLRDGGLGVEAVCGGCCSCATCHVHVAPEWLDRVGPRGEIEQELLTISSHFDDQRSRLSCQIDCNPALDGLTLTVAPEE